MTVKLVFNIAQKIANLSLFIKKKKTTKKNNFVCVWLSSI